MPGKPIGNLFGPVGEGVVQGGVNYLLRELRWRVVEEGYELLLAVFPVVLSDRGAVQDVARGTRARAAAGLAVVGARFPLAVPTVRMFEEKAGFSYVARFELSALAGRLLSETTILTFSS